MRKLRVGLSVWLLAMLLSSAAVGQNLMLWRAEKGAALIHLMGSVHFGAADMYPLDRQLLQAYSDSDLLAVEIDLLAVDTLKVAGLMMQKGMYTAPGDTLERHVAAPTWRRLNEKAAEFGLPVALIERQKPWFVALTLAALAAQRAGYREDLGIDQFFLNQAHEGGKRVIALETIEFQLGLFENLSPVQQTGMLDQMLTDLADPEAYFRRMFAAWRRGDGPALDKIVNESLASRPELRPIFERLIVARNRTMAGKIEAIVAQGQSPFVVVGAGHVIGAQGLAAHFRQQGYSVEQLRASH